jgi:Iron-containing redox enzyme
VTNSRRLRSKVRLASHELSSLAEALWTHPYLVEIYPEFLFLNHAVIRATVPLMEAAGALCRPNIDSDQLSAGLFRYLSNHIREEMNHDEWVLDDLEVLGVDRREVLRRIPPPSVAALVGSQYYWIRHHHPLALLGFIAVLEGTPPDVDYFERTADRAGLSRRAFSTLLRHGKLDPHHRDDLNDLLDELPLSEEHHSLLGISAFQTIHLLARVAKDVLQLNASPESRRAGTVP